jgi:uncharacterized protein involved in tolerance to divalent cations
MRSIYRWQGVIETAEEVAAIFKTAAALAEAACALIVRLHPRACLKIRLRPS